VDAHGGYDLRPHWRRTISGVEVLHRNGAQPSPERHCHKQEDATAYLSLGVPKLIRYGADTNAQDKMMEKLCFI